MGATKRAAEMVVHSLNEHSNTQYVIVRFGNVLGSRGSVIPRFKEQIQAGGPVTVTHPEMIRYFMTIPEASRLVIQAGCLANGGEIFVLDMGEPVKIVDLARNLIELSGKSVDEIGIEFSGIRPGEKLYEELLMDEEGINETSHQKIFIGNNSCIGRTEVLRKLEAIKNSLEQKETIRSKIKELVPTYIETHEENYKMNPKYTNKVKEIPIPQRIDVEQLVEIGG
jgi:FlaA1/EpsC-like NDP-sugar epimerase